MTDFHLFNHCHSFIYSFIHCQNVTTWDQFRRCGIKLGAILGLNLALGEALEVPWSVLGSLLGALGVSRSIFALL